MDNLQEDIEDLSPLELALFKRGLIEALLIKKGEIEPIPSSELWNY